MQHLEIHDACIDGTHVELHPLNDTDGTTIIADIDPTMQMPPSERHNVARVLRAAPEMHDELKAIVRKNSVDAEDIKRIRALIYNLEV